MVNGETRLLHHDVRLQLGRFADALTRAVPPFRIPFTGPGYRFHYVPGDRADARANLDNPEYATTVCGALQFYEQAVGAGMDPLEPRRRAAMLAWVERVLCGYWTHGGYLNWDTGAGFRRWHQGKKLGLAQAALLGIAVAPSLQPTPAHGRWAKHLFDRGLALFDRWSRGGQELPPAVLYGVVETPGGLGDSRLSAARMQANAARAAGLGLGALAAEVPPPLYAYDPDVGRLAVTTPAYSTAITVVDYDRLPYGGAELARLFDGDMRVAAGIGGRPPAAFGVVARRHGSGRIVASQRGRPRADLRHPPLRLLRAPRGAVPRPQAYPRRPYAGPFSTLEAEAVTRDQALTITTRHVFRADAIETRWEIEPRRAGAGALERGRAVPVDGVGLRGRRARGRRARAARRGRPAARRRPLAARGRRGVRLRDRAARARGGAAAAVHAGAAGLGAGSRADIGGRAARAVAAAAAAVRGPDRPGGG